MPEIRGNFGSFAEAEAYFRQKLNLPTRRWDDLWQGQHARAFVVAGVTRDAVLADLREAVDAAISQGETLEDFKRRFAGIVQKYGWIGGAGGDSEAGRAWRAAVIYHTNLRTAYQAGRWETLKHFPYLKYKHNTVRFPREQHLAWDGLVLATDDPWWSTHYPPNGWGCRCTVYGVSEARLRAEGRRPDSAPAEVSGDPPPEWRYNVGTAASGDHVGDAQVAKLANEHWTEIPGKPYSAYQRPDKLPADAAATMPLPAIRDPGELRATWNALYGRDSTLRDPSGAEIHLSDQVIQHWIESPKRLDGREKYLPLLRETIEQPFEIWANFARNARGVIGLRRYYVKRIELEEGGKKTALTMIAEVLPGGTWGSFDFFRGNKPQPRSRQGLLVWGRPLE